MDGRPVPVDLSGVFSLTELRCRIAEVLGAPSPGNVELLDEDGERLEHVEFIHNLGDMKIQTFLFGMPDPESEDEEQQFPPHPVIEELGDEGPDCTSGNQRFWKAVPVVEEHEDEGADCTSGNQDDIAKLFELKLSGEAANEMVDLNTTRASSEQADSPSRSLPLHEAVNLGDCDAVHQLLADGDNGIFSIELHKRNVDGETALHRAAYHGRLDMVNALLGARADPNAADRKGKTPLRRGYDNKEVAEALLSGGADPNAGDKYGISVLHRAAEDDHLDVAQVLLSASADPNLLSDDDLTPLHTAAIFGRAEMTKLLLSARADIHMKGVAGNRALHFAAYSGHVAAGKVLLEGGADRDARNEEGETPLEHAKTGDDDDLEWLLERLE